MSAPTDRYRDTDYYRARDAALEQFVGQRLGTLQRRYLADDPDAVAVMARLRHAVGLPAGSRPEIWATVMDELPDILADPKGFSRSERDGAPTAWERAIQDVFSLYAWHQRSREERMHRIGQRFGAAVRQLGTQTGSPEAVRRRFHALGTATGHDARMVYLRALIGLLRDHRIALDYSRLATDLRRLDHRGSAPYVLQQWGRDYHQRPSSDTDSATPAEGTSPTMTGDDL